MTTPGSICVFSPTETCFPSHTFPASRHPSPILQCAETTQPGPMVTFSPITALSDITAVSCISGSSAVLSVSKYSRSVTRALLGSSTSTPSPSSRIHPSFVRRTASGSASCTSFFSQRGDIDPGHGASGEVIDVTTRSPSPLSVPPTISDIFANVSPSMPILSFPFRC